MEKKHLILKPFNIIKDILPIFTIWILCIIVCGQLGIIGMIFTNSKNIGFLRAIALNLTLGNFYIFAIACLASNLFDFAEELLLEETPDVNFKAHKICSIVIGIILMLFMTIACFQTKYLTSTKIGDFIKQDNWFSRIWQCILYVLSLILSLYCFCLKRLNLDAESYKDLEDTKINRMKEKGKKAITDEGIEL